ncbi:MAG: hypothetical protein JNM51_14245, partial [Bacteroidia bacterium]|nr:hypothetical protein [Bacteroidia bacterium]
YFAHTGQYSIAVPAQKSLTTSKKITSAPCTTAFSPLCSYVLTCNDFIYPFSPISNAVSSKKYVLSYWVKELRASTPVFTPVLKYQNSVINVSLSGGSGSIIPVSTNSSDIIDGWQRIEYIFSIPALASGNINITLTNTSPTSSGVVSFFDDIRIHPFNSNMKSFVYNPVTLKYTAELDANNFATFYEYDEEGSLVRVKKETEKGIMTIQETKNHTKR